MSENHYPESIDMGRVVEEINRKKGEEEKERWKPRKEVLGNCHCEGKIILSVTFTREFDPKSGPPIIGPGSRGQFNRVEH